MGSQCERQSKNAPEIAGKRVVKGRQSHNREVPIVGMGELTGLIVLLDSFWEVLDYISFQSHAHLDIIEAPFY